MHQECSVLWVSGKSAADLALRKVLADGGMKVRLAQSCGEVRRVLADGSVPDVVFCDTFLPDGSWADILAMATRRPVHIPVIVVSQEIDTNLFIQALQMGVADFIVPPFYFRDISRVLKCAIWKNVAIQAPATA